jgi:hypothetical protein
MRKVNLFFKFVFYTLFYFFMVCNLYDGFHFVRH